MQTKTKLKGVKERNYIRQWLGGSILALAVFMFGFLIVPYFVAEASATTNLSAQVTWNAISLTFDPDVTATEEYESSSGASGSQIGDNGHGDIDFGSIIPTSKSGDNYGTMVITKKTLGVTTPGRYYSVYLSMSSSDQNLNYTYDGNTDTRMNIPATSGTWDTPITIVSNGQTSWGYMVPETTITKSDGSTASVFSTLTRSDINTLFSDKLDTNLIAGTGEGGGGTAYSDSLWAAVPALSAPQQIWKNSTNGATGFSDGEDFDIYFAVNVDTDTLSGEYKNQIVYTALASATSIDSVSENLIRSKALGGTGDTQTLTFDLTSNNSGFVTEDNIAIYLVPHTAMVAANYNPANFTSEQTTAYTASGNQCTVIASSLTIADKAEISCTLPEKKPADMDKITLNDSAYDFWLAIDNIGATYVSKVDAGDAPSFVYAGLQSVDDDGDTYVTKMQEMTPGICSNTNMWGHLANTSTRQNDALVYDYEGEQLVNGIATATPLANTSAASVAIGVGTFSLTDNRDNRAYLVRRLADGSCKMMQDLLLNLANFAGTQNLTSANTDLNTKTYWDPSEDAFEKALEVASAEDYAGDAITASNYFDVWSESILGTAQHYQFVPRGYDTADIFWANLDVARTYNTNPEDESKYYYIGGGDGQQYATENDTLGAAGSSLDLYYYDTAYQPETITDNTVMRGTRYIGMYYDFAAATADSGLRSVISSGTTEDSICPRGWKLPPATGTGSYESIRTEYMIIDDSTNEETSVNADSLTRLPVSLTKTGRYNYTRATTHSYRSHQQGRGRYAWTSLASSSSDARYEYMFQNDINIDGTNNRNWGATIRCVARD